VSHVATVGRRTLASAGVAGLLAAGVVACGEQKVDHKKAEDLVSNLLNVPSDVSCPDNVTYKKGGTFDCDATITKVRPPTSGSTGVSIKDYTVTVHMIGDGKLKVGRGDIQ
jgi:hypothetical protein